MDVCAQIKLNSSS